MVATSSATQCGMEGAVPEALFDDDALTVGLVLLVPKWLQKRTASRILALEAQPMGS